MSSSDGKLFPRNGRQNQQKKLKKEEEEVGDRISSLSDELLHEILSFMDTKYAVQTCVLSKRWESLWKSLPYLYFNSETFPFNFERYEGSKDNPKMTSFYNFITQVLLRRYHRTDLVKVKCQAYSCAPLPHYVVQGLIAYAVDHNVQQLTMKLWGRPRFWDYVMPRSFYTCKSLTDLVLHYIGADIPKLPRFLVLPALKSLRLTGFSMTEENFNPGDFSTPFPNLETLKLFFIHFEEDKTSFINAPLNLKRLELSSCNGHKVVIAAPGLLSFQYLNKFHPLECSFAELGSLEDAYFDCYPYGYREDETENESSIYFDYPEFALAYINTVKSFRYAESLTLSWETVAVWITRAPCGTCAFRNYGAYRVPLNLTINLLVLGVLFMYGANPKGEGIMGVHVYLVEIM